MLVYCGTATLKGRMKIATMTITIVITIAVATILTSNAQLKSIRLLMVPKVHIYPLIVAETYIHLDSPVSNATSPTTGPNRNRNWDKFISKPTIVRPNDDDSFRLENLASQGNVCGKDKCFFPLKNQIDMAYIVQQEPINGSVFHLWSTAWQFGLKIEKKHSLRHLAITPPETIKITKSFANRLNTNLTKFYNGAEKLTRRYHEGDVVVQKVRIMPTPSLLFGCNERKNSYFFNNWETKLLAFVNDKKTFRQNLEDNIRTIGKLIKSQESCLSRDFQVFVDTRGDMYHLDLDRCFTGILTGKKNERKINNTIKCLASLKRRLDKTLLINSHSL